MIQNYRVKLISPIDFYGANNPTSIRLMIFSKIKNNSKRKQIEVIGEENLINQFEIKFNLFIDVSINIIF